MVVYGYKAKQLISENLAEKCPHCGSVNSLTVYVLQKYVHIFWIPTFPTRKTGLSSCSHCKQVLELKEMPPSLTAAYESVKAQTSTPVWTFSGLALLAILIALVIYNDKRRDERNARLIAAPQAGDIFEIKMEDKRYTLYKVDQVQNDSVFIQINKYEVNKATGLSKLRDKGYSDDLYGFSQSELKEMLRKGEIRDIVRKE